MYAQYMTVYLVISLPKVPCKYMVLANPNDRVHCCWGPFAAIMTSAKEQRGTGF